MGSPAVFLVYPALEAVIGFFLHQNHFHAWTQVGTLNPQD